MIVVVVVVVVYTTLLLLQVMLGQGVAPGPRGGMLPPRPSM